MKKILISLVMLILLTGCNKVEKLTITLGEYTGELKLIGEYNGLKVATTFDSVEYSDNYTFADLIERMNTGNYMADDGGTTYLVVEDANKIEANKEFIVTVCHQIYVAEGENSKYYEGYIIGTNNQDATKCSILNNGYELTLGNETDDLTIIGEYNGEKVATTFDSVEYSEDFDFTKLFNQMEYTDYIVKDGGTRVLELPELTLVKTNKEFKIIDCNALVQNGDDTETIKGYIITTKDATICPNLTK